MPKKSRKRPVKRRAQQHKGWKRTHRQNVDSIPAYKPSIPSVRTMCLTTSSGPLKVEVLSWSLCECAHEYRNSLYALTANTSAGNTYLILTSSKGTTYPGPRYENQTVVRTKSTAKLGLRANRIVVPQSSLSPQQSTPSGLIIPGSFAAC
jgi:hypothetical protein